MKIPPFVLLLFVVGYLGRTGDAKVGKYVYHVRGRVGDQPVSYQAAPINPYTIVSLTVDGLEDATVCDIDSCSSPQKASARGAFTFWTVDPYREQNEAPQFFHGDITAASCKVQRSNWVTKFKRVVTKGDHLYTCDGGCENRDVVLCEDKVAGILEKKEKGKFIFHEIAAILKVGGCTVKNQRFGATVDVKGRSDPVLMVKVSYKDSERSYPAALIDTDTVVSYHVRNGDHHKICESRSCKPAKAKNYGNYTFWTAKGLKRTPPKFFKGQITRAVCNINRGERRNIFKRVGNRYRCTQQCKQSDVVLCDGKIAGLLGQMTHKGKAFDFHDIDAILSSVTANVTSTNTTEQEIDVKDFIVSVKIKGTKNKIPAILVKGNTIVSYKLNGATVDTATICEKGYCLKPLDVDTRGSYTFWTLKSGVKVTPPKSFRGSIEKAKCRLNKDKRKTKFTKIDGAENRFACGTKCKEADIVVCDGRAAGFLEGTDIKGEFVVKAITDILRVRRDVKGGKKPAKNGKAKVVLRQNEDATEGDQGPPATEGEAAQPASEGQPPAEEQTPAGEDGGAPAEPSAPPAGESASEAGQPASEAQPEEQASEESKEGDSESQSTVSEVWLPPPSTTEKWKEVSPIQKVVGLLMAGAPFAGIEERTTVTPYMRGTHLPKLFGMLLAGVPLTDFSGPEIIEEDETDDGEVVEATEEYVAPEEKKEKVTEADEVIKEKVTEQDEEEVEEATEVTEPEEEVVEEETEPEAEEEVTDEEVETEAATTEDNETTEDTEDDGNIGKVPTEPLPEPPKQEKTSNQEDKLKQGAEEDGADGIRAGIVLTLASALAVTMFVPVVY